MPSLISHAIAGIAIGVALSVRHPNEAIICSSVIASVFPDIDGIAFVLGIPYNNFFGHRGFFHSIFFAFILSFLILHIGFHYIELFTKTWLFHYTIFFLLTLSHSILDAMTEGGMGVAFFSPFSQKRYLLPWRPMIACPLRIRDFFSEWGKIVLKSELICIWLPSFMLILISIWLKNTR